VDMHSQALFPKVQQITEVSPIMITTLQMWKVSPREVM
jgi:hypothetical protein